MIRIEDGEKLEANYFGRQISGTVLSSRVKYGGELQYTVQLDQPVKFKWRTDPRNVVLVNESDVTSMTIQLAEAA